MKKFWVILSIMSLLLFSTQIQTATVMASEDISLLDLVYESSSDYVYENTWGESNFQDVKGNAIAEGLGLATNVYNGGSTRIDYNLESFNYKTLKTKISLDSKWLNGYGKTAIGIYANDVMLYEKQLKATDGILNVELKLPENTKSLYIIVNQIAGDKGTQGVILINPSLSVEGSYAASVNSARLESLEISTSGGFFNFYSKGEPLQDGKGNIVTNGIAMDAGGDDGTVKATYKLNTLGFNVFETKISLDSKFTNGDFGRSTVGIYADDYLLYEKELTFKNSIESLKLNIPKGTKELHLVVKQLDGRDGTESVVFINPLLKKTNNAAIVIQKTTSLATIGSSDTAGHFFKNQYKESELFQYQNGQIPTSGVAMTTDGSTGGTAYATFNIANKGYNAFKSKLSLDYKWLTDEFGTSSVYIYADKNLIYNTALKKSEIKDITVRIPANSKTVKVLVKQKRGGGGTHNVVFGNAVFTNLPVSNKLETKNVTIKNNKKTEDTITISSLSKNDVVKVYNSKHQVVAIGKTTGSTISLKVKQLGIKNGLVYVTRTTVGKLESEKIVVSFKAE
jgi:hypothetical protein